MILYIVFGVCCAVWALILWPLWRWAGKAHGGWPKRDDGGDLM